MKFKLLIICLTIPFLSFCQDTLVSILERLNEIQEAQFLPEGYVKIKELNQLNINDDAIFEYNHPQIDDLKICLLKINNFKEFAIYAITRKECLLEENIIFHEPSDYLFVDFTRHRYLCFNLSNVYSIGRGNTNEFIVNIDLLSSVESIEEIDNFFKPKATIQIDFDINDDSFGGKIYQCSSYKQENKKWYKNIIDVNNRNLSIEQIGYDQFLSLFNKIDNVSNWVICEDRYFTFYHIRS